MLKQVLYSAAALGAVAAATIAIANDSTAERTTGGLVLRNSRNIDMVDEDLYVSPERIRVNYVFRNTASRDESVIVAFPMPDRNLQEEANQDTGVVSDFQTTVEGRPVRAEVEARAMLGNVDHTALLNRLRIPLAPPAHDWQDFYAAFNRLSPAELAQLQRVGLIEVDGEGENRTIWPKWTFKQTYYWTQTFPAGRDLHVQHSYVPGAGGSVGSILSIPADPANAADRRAYIARYCVDQAFLGAVRRMQAGRADNQLLPEITVGYILRTGANWRSPIRNFRLVVDKLRPENIVSFCGTGLRRISPTQFEMRRTDWRPDRDLEVLILQPPQRYEEPAS